MADFNRTLLELKFEQRWRLVHISADFNRTLLELKFNRNIEEWLILADFNRTLLELKFRNIFSASLLFRILIAPYWN